MVSTARVLVADDDDFARHLVRDALLRAAGGRVEILEADNGSAAIARLGEGSFRLVVTDYRMPLAHGIEVLHAARKLQPDAARVLLTGFLDDAVADGARSAGLAHEVYEKPFAPRDWGELVREVVERHLA